MEINFKKKRIFGEILQGISDGSPEETSRRISGRISEQTNKDVFERPDQLGIFLEDFFNKLMKESHEKSVGVFIEIS